MALLKENLWSLVAGTEAVPLATEKDKLDKYRVRRDRALAVIVLSVDPKLLYLLGDPEDPASVWKLLENHFQRKTWANKLELRRKLFSLRLSENGSVQTHVKAMTEVFEGLAVIGAPVEEEDKVVQILASLPDSYNMLVTALEANENVPKLEVVTERLLHEERKMRERSDAGDQSEKAMTTRRRKPGKGPQCYRCQNFGHIARNCPQARDDGAEGKAKQKKPKQRAAKAAVKRRNSSSSESAGVVVCGVMSGESSPNSDAWIVDSGATSHMCHDRDQIEGLQNLDRLTDVTVGDGRVLQAKGVGSVVLRMRLPNGQQRRCHLRKVLFVPDLAFNLFSVAQATSAGKRTTFSDDKCYLRNQHQKLIGVGEKADSLYKICCSPRHSVNAVIANQVSKETTWHRRFGHLGLKNLQKLSKEKMVDNFDFDVTKALSFCEPCVHGKHHRSAFPTDGGTRATRKLGLVHTDVCGHMNVKSIGGARYFLTFIDDFTRYVWVYILKTKDEAFEKFQEWKALVENSTGEKLKALRSDNGGEYISREFDAYLKTEGVHHQLTVKKTPEQNGVAERQNRVLVEKVRSMLSDSNLPQHFWAEALKTAVYLRNRSPTKAVKAMTPEKAWSGDKPRVNHLRTFGCAAYAHIEKDERKKLDAKAKRCVFMGYSSQRKSYRLWDPDRSRINQSRDVVFNEAEVGLPPRSDDNVRTVDVGFSSDGVEIDNAVNTPVAEGGSLRTSTRVSRPPDRFGEWTSVANLSSGHEPRSFNEAVSGASKEKWLAAMEDEMSSIGENEVWDIVERPAGRKVIGSRWVYKCKTNSDGDVVRFKARLVARGFAQQFGLDYDETFSPVVRLETLRSVFALAAQGGMTLHQMDVKTAFLNGQLEEEVYMEQPSGFVKEGTERRVCRLKKSLYGLKQSPRCWNVTLNDQLLKMGFEQSTSDPCLYVTTTGNLVVLAVFVDDIVLASKDEKRIKDVKKSLAQRFDVKDMGKLEYFLGFKVRQEADRVCVGQPAYAEEILKRYGMMDCRPVDKPMEVGNKLVKADSDEELADASLYQSAVGMLLYLANGTRPDISFAVSYVARFSSKPTKQHWIAIKRIMRYLRGTLDYGLCYSADGNASCVGYSDADWAGDVNDRKSVSGYVFKIGGAAVSWRSKKQPCVALSTAEAEYVALAGAAQEAVWLGGLCADMQRTERATMTVYEDNQAAIAVSKNPQSHGRMKHIDIKFHFIREQVEKKVINLVYCSTSDMIADALTKGLAREQFAKLRQLMGVVQI